MTESCSPLVSYFLKRHILALPIRKVGVPRGRLFPSGLCLSATYISSSLGAARPFTNKVEKCWKKCTDPMVGGARSITLYEAQPPLVHPQNGECGHSNRSHDDYETEVKRYFERRRYLSLVVQNV